MPRRFPLPPDRTVKSGDFVLLLVCVALKGGICLDGEGVELAGESVSVAVKTARLCDFLIISLGCLKRLMQLLDGERGARISDPSHGFVFAMMRAL